jgi:hypothetical protein
MKTNKSLTFEFPELNGNARLRELILYVSKACADDPSFGATKLNKILYYADFNSYFEFGQAVCGIEYQRLDNGPAPKQLVPVREQMIDAGEIAEKQVEFYTKKQKRCVPLRKADLSRFSERDLKVIDEAIRKLWGKTAKEVSNMSHTRAWRIVKDRESIPYQAVFLSDNDDLTPNELERISALNREHKWE